MVLFHCVGSIETRPEGDHQPFTNAKGMRAMNCIVVCLQGRFLLYKASSAAAVHRVRKLCSESWTHSLVGEVPLWCRRCISK